MASVSWNLNTIIADCAEKDFKEVYSMNKQLHPTFQTILNNALNIQIERERKQPKERQRETYLEWHESREELQYLNNGFERSRF